MTASRAKTRPAMLQLFVDGGSRGNPGPAGGGVVLADAQGEPLVERGYFFGRATNNVAEYSALLRGLDLAASFQPERLEIFADSELMVRQITGQYRVKNEGLIPLFEEAQVALLKFDNWQIRHVPRAKNERADRMANKAMTARADVEDDGDEAPPAKAPMPSPPPSATASAGEGLAVEATVTLGCDPRICPATMMVGEVFRFEETAPAGLCLYAASALVPAALELFARVAVSGRAQVPTRTVTCPRPGCSARFELRLVE